MIYRLVGLLLILGATAFTAQARRIMRFEALSLAMQGHLRPMTQIDPASTLLDCSMISPEQLAGMRGSTVSQWIFNGGYQWTTIDMGLGTGNCVLLESPLKRGLSREEVQMLLSASMREWQVDPETPQQETPDSELHIDSAHVLPDNMERSWPSQHPCDGKDCERLPAKVIAPASTPSDQRVTPSARRSNRERLLAPAKAQAQKSIFVD